MLLLFVRVVNYYNYSITDWDFLVNQLVSISICMSTNLDPHTKTNIYNDEIWTRSQCLQKEDAVCEVFAQALSNMGYQPQNSRNRVWTRGNKKVVVCLVDDIVCCSEPGYLDIPYMFDRDTTVITDNYITCPTQYQVWRLPPSFFGIYSHTVTPRPWAPDRNFTFSINRLDIRRQKLMLELAKRIHLHKGHVNFNAQLVSGARPLASHETLQQNFVDIWNQLSEHDQELWSASYRLLAPQMPLRTYDMPHDEIYTRSWINIECETYTSDNTVAFSEKIFRLLTTPALWVSYLGRYGVAYLESIGFDCMSDIVRHNHYDRLKEVESKVGVFVWFALETSKWARTRDFESTQQRAIQAAENNQALLKSYAQQWPSDFAQWQQTYLPRLA